MVYVCEFEFYDNGEGATVAFPLGGLGGATFGDNLIDAVKSAADWLSCMVDDALMSGRELPPVTLGNAPTHGGQVIAVATSRELRDIPAMCSDSAREILKVSEEGLNQLIESGSLESWMDDGIRMVSVNSVVARLEYGDC